MSAMGLVNQDEVDEECCEIANRNIERGKKEIEEYRRSKLTTCQVGVVQSRFRSKCKSPDHNIACCPKMLMEDGPN